MVEIDFRGLPTVLRAYSDVMTHINTRDPQQAAWNDRHRNLMTRLLSEMAKILGYKLHQLDVLEGGYYPQGFVDMENEQQAVRRVLIEVLSGRRPLLVSSAVATPPSPFPPPPQPTVD